MKIHKKLQKKSQNLLKVLPKTVPFRNIALIFSLKKPCYLENRVVREPCKRRSACKTFLGHSKTFLGHFKTFLGHSKTFLGRSFLELFRTL